MVGKRGGTLSGGFPQRCLSMLQLILPLLIYWTISVCKSAFSVYWKVTDQNFVHNQLCTPICHACIYGIPYWAIAIFKTFAICCFNVIVPRIQSSLEQNFALDKDRSHSRSPSSTSQQTPRRSILTTDIDSFLSNAIKLVQQCFWS